MRQFVYYQQYKIANKTPIPIILMSILIGHYKPLYYLFGGTFIVPLSLSYFNIITKGNSRDVGMVITLFSIILIDYLFRLYGGGTHDQVGKTLCDISLAIQMVIVWIIIIYNKIKEYKLKVDPQRTDVTLILQTVGYIAFPIFFYFLFNNF